jgi:hypothetical protein
MSSGDAEASSRGPRTGKGVTATTEQWRAGLSQESAKTEAQLEDVKSRIVQAENRIAELKAALSREDCALERTQKQLELT